MDWAVRHSVFSCQRLYLDHSVKSNRAPQAFLIICQHRRVRNKSSGASSFPERLNADLVPSSSRFLASRHGDASYNSRKTHEDQMGSVSSQDADLKRAKQKGRAPHASLTNRNTNDVDSVSTSHLTRRNSTNNNCAAKLTSNSDPSDAKLTDDRKDVNENARISRPWSGQTISEAFNPCENYGGNGGAAPSPSVPDDEAFLSSGPLVEMHSRVSGNNGSSVFNNSDPSLSYLVASKNIIEFISRFPAWADAQKESGMPQRQQRAFYSHADWLRHRSSLRHIRHVLSSLSSRVIVSLVPPVFTFTAGAIGVAAYNTALKLSFLPSFFPLLHAASIPYELTAPALALLLVFRTDASYSRYDEARKTWTNVISTTKDLARQSAQLIKSSHDVAIKSSLLSYIMAFPVSLKCHLIHGSDTRKDLQGLLEDDDLAFILASHHRPNCLIQLMSQSLGLLHLEDTERVLLENHITQYNSSVSICERLIRTPIPLSYTRLTSRFLVLWHMSLPIVLWDACNWLVVPATFFSASTLFCIEEVGVLIEEPFPMLALDKIIGVAHDNIREMMKRQQETDYFLSRKRSHQTTHAHGGQ